MSRYNRHEIYDSSEEDQGTALSLDLARRATYDIVKTLRNEYPKVWKRLMHCPPGTKGMPLLASKTIGWMRICERIVHDQLTEEKNLSKKELVRRAASNARRLLTKEEREALGLEF